VFEISMSPRSDIVVGGVAVHPIFFAAADRAIKIIACQSGMTFLRIVIALYLFV